MTKNQTKIIYLQPWMPFKFDSETGTIKWCRIDGLRFKESFFSEDLQKIMHSRTEVIETPVEILMNLKLDSLKTAGFIYHVSRCGSTLISQLFSELPQCRVLSEPPILDEFLYWLNNNSSINYDDKKILFNNLVKALGRVNLNLEKYLIIKLDCWNIEYYNFIKEVFPEVPSVFVYREPLAVIKSHLRLRGQQMVPGAIKSGLLNFDADIQTAEDFNLYMVRVLEKIFQAGIALQHTCDQLLINYNQLPSIAWTKLLEYFNISFDETDIQLMIKRSAYDAKNIGLAFNSGQKSEKVPDEIIKAASINLADYFDQLEKLRLESRNS